MNHSRILSLRMQRQGLTEPLTGDAYDELFRGMSPVHTLYWTEPGAPPTLQRRAAFDDWEYNNQRRAARLILKGRYQNGSVGYVDRRDLELYACAYCKPVEALDFNQLTLLEMISRDGPLTIASMKQATGLLVKKITPVLHRLQQAFLVFEDQTGGEGDRLWYAFDSVFPEVDTNKYSRVEAIKQIILRFLPLAVCAEAEAVVSYYGFSVRETAQALQALTAEGAVKAMAYNGRTFYCAREDEALVTDGEDSDTPTGVFLLHRSDFWVKSEEYALKGRYKADRAEVLYYIVIDGEIKGAVMGRFKFGPHVLEDVLLDLPEDEKTARREEILEAVYEIFDRMASPVMRYEGEPLP